MFSTTPASSPPSTTRPQLILPIVTSGREKSDQHAAPTVWADTTAVKQLCASGHDQDGHHPTHPVRDRCHTVWHHPIPAVHEQVEVIQAEPQGERSLPQVAFNSA